ncbi:MAG: helix-turn-helix domain-containing protein, partial [Desulfuromonadales bacterium]
ESDLAGLAEEGVRASAGSSGLYFPNDLPTIREAISQLIAEASRRAGGNQSTMAGMLGISRPALNKRLKKLDDLD